MSKKPHVGAAHALWQEIILPTDTVIDATCGNGRDTLELARLVPQGKVLAFDIQQEAIESAKKRLKVNGLESRVEFYYSSHENFPFFIGNNSIRLVVYNLGYLPGGNKQLTTHHEATLKSVQSAMKLLIPGGVISITLYPGHPEGEIEKNFLLHASSKLSPSLWEVRHLEWGHQASPSLLLLKKLENLLPSGSTK